jgi:predicted RNase H-like HicB family nuclease
MDSTSYGVDALELPSVAAGNLRKTSWDESRSDIKQEIQHFTVLVPKVILQGIQFSLRKDGEYFFLENAEWPSLMAHGLSVQEAIENTLRLISEVVQEYVFVRESELSRDAVELRIFLIEKLFA